MNLLVTLARVPSVGWWGWNFECSWVEERIGDGKVVMAVMNNCFENLLFKGNRAFG